MKKIVLILICLPIFAIAQKHKRDVKQQIDTVPNIMPVTNQVIMYTGVVALDSTIPKAELFNRAKSWFVTTYRSAKDVIQMEDKDAGILIGKGIFNIIYNGGFFEGIQNVSVYHTIKLYFKDGRYKYEITEFNGQYYHEETRFTTAGFRNVDIKNNGYEKNKKNYNKFLETINLEVIKTIQSLKTAMSMPLTTKDF